MFLNNCSMTRPPPSLLPGSDGTRSPSFNRYYEAAKTTAALLASLRLSRCAAIPRVDFPRSLAVAGKSLRRRQGVVGPVSPSLPVFVPRTLSVLPSSLRTLLTFALLSDPGRFLAPDPLTALGCGPRNCYHEDTDQLCLSRLYHTASVMAVYASCRPLGRLRKTRFRWRISLSGWVFPSPQSSFGEFHTFALPSPRTSLGAKQFSL